MRAKESVIQHQILRYLSGLGAYTSKTVVGNKSGIPDITACFNGRYIAIEVKAKDKEATDLQKYNIDKIIKAGGIAFVAHSVEEVINYLLKNNIFNKK